VSNQPVRAPSVWSQAVRRTSLRHTFHVRYWTRDQELCRKGHCRPVLGSTRAESSTDIHRRAYAKPQALDAADTLDFLRVPPSNRLEQFRGDREGQCSIRINDQWRICFRWEEHDASDVEVTDYH